MYKAKIQPFAPFVGGRTQILHLLLRRQGIPLPISLLVAPRIIRLVEDIEEDIENADTYQDPIPTAICKV